MFWIVLLCIVIVLIYKKLSKIHNEWNQKGVKQRKQIYLLGDSAKLMFKKETMMDLFNDIYNAFPNERYVGFYQATLPYLMIKDIELLNQITVKNFDHFVDHRMNSVTDDPVWTQNLFVLQGNEWRKMRSKVSPIFTTSKMKIIFNLLSECGEKYVSFFKKTGGSASIELKDLYTRYANDVIGSLAFGVQCDSILDKENEFYLMGKDITNISFGRMVAFFGHMISPRLCMALGLTIFPKYLTNFYKNLVNDSIKLRQEQGMRRMDLIHLMLETRKNKQDEEKTAIDAGFAAVEDTKPLTDKDIPETTQITDTDITAQAIVFFFAGFESVSGALSFLGYELTVNPDIQQRLQEEIDDTMEACGGKLTYEALMKMKYMDMVVSETLRKWPPAVGTDRVCTKTFTIEPKNNGEKPVTIQPGDNLWIPITPIHRDPKYWPNPEKFDPERFSDENKGKIVPYSYMPFGNGPRHCIGSRFALMEVKTATFHLLRNFDFVVTEKTEIPIKIKRGFVNLDSENGIWIGLKPSNR